VGSGQGLPPDGSKLAEDINFLMIGHEYMSFIGHLMICLEICLCFFRWLLRCLTWGKKPIA
jgi:hypothetical protein